MTNTRKPKTLTDLLPGEFMRKLFTRHPIETLAGTLAALQDDEAELPEGVDRTAAVEFFTQQLVSAVSDSIPRLMVYMRRGAYEPIEEFTQMEDFYTRMLKSAEDALGMENALRELPPTVRNCGLELAKVADKYSKIARITALNEAYVNRDAAADILAGHAMMCRGIAHLNDVPESYRGDK